MTEYEWTACSDPMEMAVPLRHVGKSSDRKLRLFACACVRIVWDHLLDGRSRTAVEITEEFADGKRASAELDVAQQAAYEASQHIAVVLRPGGIAALAQLLQEASR